MAQRFPSSLPFDPSALEIGFQREWAVVKSLVEGLPETWRVFHGIPWIAPFHQRMQPGEWDARPSHKEDAESSGIVRYAALPEGRALKADIAAARGSHSMHQPFVGAACRRDGDALYSFNHRNDLISCVFK